MIQHPSIIQTSSTDVHGNLAVEECLLRAVRPGECILFLWQNSPCVGVGRNQLASAECDLAAMEADGVALARRLSGGGAVYHDPGDLNFAFVLPTADYDQDAQNQVILDAVRSLGVAATKNDRNDLLTPDGRKFSGSAYLHADGSSYHHGTLLVDVDTGALERYLSVNPNKLHAHGVRSVRSRVANLTEFQPSITVERLRQALVDSFERAMGRHAEPFSVGRIDGRRVASIRKRLSSPSWLYQGERRFDERCQARFAWGTVEADLTLREGTIRDIAFFSDGFDTELYERVPKLLVGSKATQGALEVRLKRGGIPERMSADIARLIAV